jgi:hypothetical protein
MATKHKNLSSSVEGQNNLSTSFEEAVSSEAQREATATPVRPPHPQIKPTPHKNITTSAEGYTNPSTSAEEFQ